MSSQPTGIIDRSFASPPVSHFQRTARLGDDAGDASLHQPSGNTEHGTCVVDLLEEGTSGDANASRQDAPREAYTLNEESHDEQNARLVYLMHGLPRAGKSYSARRLAGPSGAVCQTDEYFYTQVGDDPTSYDYHRTLMKAARRWNMVRFKRAVDEGRSPIVVDRGNGLNRQTFKYARYAAENGYRVELKEPESPWWLEIRILLQEKDRNHDALDRWAEFLAIRHHDKTNTRPSSIRRLMDAWKPDLTVEKILNFKATKKKTCRWCQGAYEPHGTVFHC